jgi:hypothetical protein
MYLPATPCHFTAFQIVVTASDKFRYLEMFPNSDLQLTSLGQPWLHQGLPKPVYQNKADTTDGKGKQTDLGKYFGIIKVSYGLYNRTGTLCGITRL